MKVKHILIGTAVLLAMGQAAVAGGEHEMKTLTPELSTLAKGSDDKKMSPLESHVSALAKDSTLAKDTAELHKTRTAEDIAEQLSKKHKNCSFGDPRDC
jgi:hypothetical protein